MEWPYQKNEMEFFYSSVKVSVRKGIPEGTQPKIFSQIFILI